ncbi:MAG: hypothetical protein HUU29_06685 [Planctomycetaceae bacterium]|nr:hypothetical protein [Planctomycetaceae bacterium]
MNTKHQSFLSLAPRAALYVLTAVQLCLISVSGHAAAKALAGDVSTFMAACASVAGIVALGEAALILSRRAMLYPWERLWFGVLSAFNVVAWLIVLMG